MKKKKKEGSAEASGAHVLTESHVLPVLSVHGSAQMRGPWLCFFPGHGHWMLHCGVKQVGPEHSLRLDMGTQQGGHRKPSSYAAVRTMDCFQGAPGVSSNNSDCLLPWAPLSCLCVSRLSLFPGPDALDPGTCCDVEWAGPGYSLSSGWGEQWDGHRKPGSH